MKDQPFRLFSILSMATGIANSINLHRGQLELNGIKPKDHMKENRDVIKKKQIEVKSKEADDNKEKGTFMTFDLLKLNLSR